MKLSSYFLVSVFLILISIPLVGDLTGLTIDQKLNENKFVKGYDSLPLSQKVALYLKNYDSKFWGREYLVKAYIKLKKDFFKISPLPEKVLIGKSGWLFLTDYGAMDDYRNVRPFLNTQLDSIETYLTKVAHDLREKQMRLYVIVVPDKHTIYPEYLPENVRKIRSTSRLQQLEERLKSKFDFEFINLTDTLLSSKQQGYLYYKQESHWNDLGTFIGYQKVMKSMKKDFPKLNVVELATCKVYLSAESDLDLAKLLGEPIEYTESTQRIEPANGDQIIRVESGVTIPPAKRLNPNYAFRKVNSGVTGPSVLVYRDSFFGSLVPFFEQSFAESTYIWTNDVELAYAKQESTQVVVLQIAERHIDLLTH